MTRLDANRAKTQLAQKAGVPVADVTNVAIWGNHSATQYPDAYNATHRRQERGYDVIGDEAWLQGGFIETVQKRGAAIIEARGLSVGRQRGERGDRFGHQRREQDGGGRLRVARGVQSQGEYGVPEGLQFGFPVAADGKGGWSVVEGFELNDFAKAKIAVTTDELASERDEVRSLGLDPLGDRASDFERHLEVDAESLEVGELLLDGGLPLAEGRPRTGLRSPSSWACSSSSKAASSASSRPRYFSRKWSSITSDSVMGVSFASGR